MRWIAAVVALAACGDGDDVDLAGVYRIDAEAGSLPCGADEPYTPFRLFMKLTWTVPAEGPPYFELVTCDHEDGPCSPLLGADRLDDPINGGWRGVVSYGLTAGSCSLNHVDQSAWLSGSSLVLERYWYAEDGSVDACTVEEAAARGTSMPCIEHVRIEATKL
jgi:hypothetical protein